MGKPCTYCGSEDTVLSGKRRTNACIKQLVRCNACERIFTADQNTRMRYHPDIVSTAVSLGKQGKSLSEIQSALMAQYNKKVSRWSILQWLNRHEGINKQAKKAEAKEKKRLAKFFKGKVVLVTGGTGSVGRELVKEILAYQPKVVRIFDIDETEHFEMEREFELEMPWVIKQDMVRFLVGDVKDKERIKRAMERVDIVFHLAGLKHVASCEYNPFEAVKTNVIGTQNLIDAALEHNVERVIFTSSDKAAYPHNTMGATKLLAERLITSANYYKGGRRTIFASVRFGNVMGSRGSVIPLFLKQIQRGGPVTITDPAMTRFMMSKSQAIWLILKCARIAKGGETFILKMPVARIGDLASVLIQESARKYGYEPESIKTKIIGLKPGETHYEELMTEEEASRAIETQDLFIVPPLFAGTQIGIPSVRYQGGAARPKHYNSRAVEPITAEGLRVLLYKEGILRK
ncbi:MAG: UDP-N-acetylglucosamine 4,6-dehydratase family protein [Candidatus Woesearchaeota archaeon]